MASELRLVGELETGSEEVKGEEDPRPAIEREDSHEDAALLLQLLAERMKTLLLHRKLRLVSEDKVKWVVRTSMDNHCCSSKFARGN